MIRERMGLEVAGLELWLDARGSGVRLAAPASYARFMAARGSGGGLTLRVCDGPLRSTEGWRPLFSDPETWQLWLDGAGCRVFVPSRRSPPPRQVAVDGGYGSGEVLGAFGATGAGQSVYPLKDIDVVFFANWLAESGDFIVHAAGVDDGGAGYAFVGPSGSGKSTLVTSLFAPSAAGDEAVARNGRVAILGEDTVILRYQGGNFLVYGTPWHTDPACCSPGGVPLVKLFFLDRTLGHSVKSCGPADGIERLLQNALIPYYNRAGVARILDRLSCLAGQVPFYALGFRDGADVMKLIRDA